MTRRHVLAALAATTAIGTSPAFAAARRAIPKGFLWGAAISAHQSEGNDVNSDSWLLENLPETVYKEPSGDACDSYHRYEQDFAIARSIGLNCYRFGIEWARIEPEPGRFSQSELDHYVQVLASCRAHDLLPIVTYNHFAVPRWFAMRGGWEVPDSADLFARFCERTTRSLGDQIGMASPFNEANIHQLVKLLRTSATPEYVARRRAMMAAAARATNAPRFSSILFTDPDRIDAHLLDAQAKAYQAIKAGPGDFPVGVTLTTQAIEAAGEDSIAPQIETMLYGSWWDAVNASDFIGVQTYTRFRFDSKMLRGEGVRVAIDDFGMGYSSLSRLAGLPLDALKIDRSFVDHLNHDPQSQAIVSTIIAVAKACGLCTVAKGVETAAQLEILDSLGCDLSQGYFHCPPVSSEELELFVGSMTSSRS